MLKCYKCGKEGLFEVGYYESKVYLLCYDCWHKDTPSIIKDKIDKNWQELLRKGKSEKNMLGTYKLKRTLYPTFDGDLSIYKEDHDEVFDIYRKGTIWCIVSKEEYCKLQNYDDDETDEFTCDNCDFEVVAYMKNNDGKYILLNSLEDFEKIE